MYNWEHGRVRKRKRKKERKKQAKVIKHMLQVEMYIR